MMSNVSTLLSFICLFILVLVASNIPNLVEKAQKFDFDT